MAELATIAGERSLILNSKEAFTLRTGAQNQEGFDAVFNEIVDEYDDPNEYPVIVSNGFIIPQGGIYSDRELKVGLETGHIICDPAPTPEAGARINGSSIDVTLGKYFYTAGEEGDMGLFNPYTQEDTYQYFNIDPENPDASALEAKPWGEVKKKLGHTAVRELAEKLDYIPGIPEHHPMILLRPNERILAHTNEFIGILPPGTTSMQARSSFGRIGVSVCYDAGWGDPGFGDRWTKEIKNHNENDFIPLPVGIRDAQIVFMSTGPVQTEYATATGNYQRASFAQARAELEAELGYKINYRDFNPREISTSGLYRVSRRFRANVKKNWKPSHTIPRLHSNTLHPLAPVEGLAKGWV
ncbi:TPA: hypothetical protein DD425_01995 [Candidatus Saccharibacteria bacterium]|nr:hypothetical protein [Candidatus Saccharibacteria bacterium]|tara:strand:- start:541 stop:1608 length:1068 start_codon:yes stop_codon:yes gene_type:complete